MINRRNDKDARRKWQRRRKTSLTIFTSHFIVRVRKGLLKVCMLEGVGDRTETYSRHVVFLVLWCSTGGPEATLLGDGFLYGILSASSPDLNLSGPKGPSGLMWLSLPHLASNSVRSSTQLARRTQLSYIIVRCPLDLWNRMFNRHQAEITVMQFRGHSLPVHQSMSVPWEFFSSSHFISQFPPTRFPLITAIRMCHLLPVHHLGMAFLAGSKGQNITRSLGPRIVSIVSGGFPM